MGQAIVRGASLFLFDEPLSNLDAQLHVRMRTAIKVLHRMVGLTTIDVPHDQIAARTLADRIVIANVGGIAQIGTPLDLCDKPADNCRIADERVTEASIRQASKSRLPKCSDVAQAQPIERSMDVPAIVAQEIARLTQACDDSDFGTIIARCRAGNISAS